VLGARAARMDGSPVFNGIDAVAAVSGCVRRRDIL
jgi:hypothetical protein